MIGEINGKILEAFIETIPIEFSILDKNDRVLAWNKHTTRIFNRPESVIGRNVRNCHPKKSLLKVEQIINEMKSGTRDKARFWIDLEIEKNKGSRKIMIEYFALRDKENNYIGCLEASQDITEIQKLEGNKRLID
jgi:PAS domain S-box-containing protein